MISWKEIHPGFTEELQKSWEDFGFIYEQVEEWVKIRGFFDLKDAEFAIYLGDKEYVIDDMSKEEIEILRKDYEKVIKEGKVGKEIESSSLKSRQIVDPDDESWKNIRTDFTPQLVKEWQELGFSYEEIQDWISIGVELSDARFCAWLRDEIKVSSEWVLDNGDFELLRNEYQQFFTAIQ